MYKAYCEYCNLLVEFNTIENQELYCDLFEIKYLGTSCFCNLCGNEIDVSSIGLDNFKRANDQFMKTLISPIQINELLLKYNIDSVNFSKFLGWNPDKIDRYLNGYTPSKRNSDFLFELLNSQKKIYIPKYK